MGHCDDWSSSSVLKSAYYGYSDLKTARRLCETPTGRALRLVALTGYGQGPYRELSRLAGFDVHLVKPVAVDAVLQAIAIDPAS